MGKEVATGTSVLNIVSAHFWDSYDINYCQMVPVL